MNAEEEKDFARQGYRLPVTGSTSSVACIDWLQMLDVIHVFQDGRSFREDLVDNKWAALVGSELASSVKEMDSSQY